MGGADPDVVFRAVVLQRAARCVVVAVAPAVVAVAAGVAAARDRVKFLC